MRPAFRSTQSALYFSAIVLFLLVLPVLVSWIGLPSRKEAWSGVSTHAGAVGDLVQTIFEDPKDADILFVGPSILKRAVEPSVIERALSLHLGRAVHVSVLSMSWAGADLH